MLGYLFRVPSPSTLQPTNHASAGAMLVSETEATFSVASSRTGAVRILSTRTYSANATLVWANETSANAADFARYASASAPGDVSSIDLSDWTNLRNELRRCQAGYECRASTS